MLSHSAQLTESLPQLVSSIRSASMLVLSPCLGVRSRGRFLCVFRASSDYLRVQSPRWMMTGTGKLRCLCVCRSGREARHPDPRSRKIDKCKKMNCRSSLSACRVVRVGALSCRTGFRLSALGSGRASPHTQRYIHIYIYNIYIYVYNIYIL